MTQTIVQIGNSAGVIIPQSLREELNLQIGDKITMKKKGKDIILSSTTSVSDVVDPEVYAVAKDLLKRYLPAFQELAKK
ncbi:MAG TPA: AbrB/MazE/SpoVT family DNA-binding domain-containing protein [Patescibacteria group bacterium]|nr:AbrB/MazE/SpoVT family DNA-binding domain-containing protein [Patescibacteria group bacterium]